LGIWGIGYEWGAFGEFFWVQSEMGWKFGGLRGRVWVYCGSDVRIISAHVSMVSRFYSSWRILDTPGLDVDDKSFDVFRKSIEIFGGCWYGLHAGQGKGKRIPSFHESDRAGLGGTRLVYRAYQQLF